MSNINLAALFKLLSLSVWLSVVSGRQFQLTSVGCFKDIYQTQGRDMNQLKDFGFYRLGDSAMEHGRHDFHITEAAVTSSQMTHELCGSVCALGGFRYIGVQAGEWCFCSNSYGGHGIAPSSECSHKCFGNSFQNCGGGGRNFVLKLTFTHEQRLFVPGNRTLVGINKPEAPAFVTVGTLGIAECLYRCRAGCQAVVFNRQQRLCHLLEFAVVPAALSGISSGDFFVRG